MDNTTATTRKHRKISIKQATFARLVALGKSQQSAYREVYGKPGTGYACRLVALPQVAEEIERLRKGAEAACDMKRDEMVSFLTKVIRTPIGELHEEHPLVQEWTVTRRGGSETTKVRMIDKLAAVRVLCQLMGWMKPTEAEGEMTIVLKKMWE